MQYCWNLSNFLTHSLRSPRWSVTLLVHSSNFVDNKLKNSETNFQLHRCAAVSEIKHTTPVSYTNTTPQNVTTLKSRSTLHNTHTHKPNIQIRYIVVTGCTAERKYFLIIDILHKFLLFSHLIARRTTWNKSTRRSVVSSSVSRSPLSARGDVVKNPKNK